MTGIKKIKTKEAAKEDAAFKDAAEEVDTDQTQIAKDTPAAITFGRTAG